MRARETNQINELLEQLARDNKRREWNAIDRARGFASLLMAMYRQKGIKFQSFDELVPRGQCDRAYYAQIADAKLYRIPSGKNILFTTALGLQSRSALTRYRAILKLPNEIWQLANKHNLAEETLDRLARLEPQKAIQIAHNLTDTQNTAIASIYNVGTRRYFSQLSALIRQAKQDNVSAKREAKTMINDLRNWLDQIEREIDVNR